MMRLTIVGFGNQAKAWSQNLQDSIFPFRVALRDNSPSMNSALTQGVSTVIVGSSDFYADKAYALLTPDHTHEDFMNSHGKQFAEGSVILYAHGYSLLKNKFEIKFPHLKHVLLAPKAIGTELRRQYQLKGKLGAVYSLEHVKDDPFSLEKWIMKLSVSLGINLGPYPTTFKHETQADLYSEQGLLCSLIPYAAKKMFEDLVEDGIEPELAYFECWHELKLIINAMVDKGPIGFFDLISPNALIGSEKGYERLFTPAFESQMKGLFKDIKSGAFDQELEMTDVETLRNKIRDRWREAPLMKTFEKINQRIDEKT